jgi:hypothetical protein
VWIVRFAASDCAQCLDRLQVDAEGEAMVLQVRRRRHIPRRLARCRVPQCSMSAQVERAFAV